MSKPIVGLLLASCSRGRRMGHAGAIVSGGDDTAKAKMQILEECGISVGICWRYWQKDEKALNK